MCSFCIFWALFWQVYICKSWVNVSKSISISSRLYKMTENNYLSFTKQNNWFLFVSEIDKVQNYFFQNDCSSVKENYKLISRYSELVHYWLSNDCYYMPFCLCQIQITSMTMEKPFSWFSLHGTFRNEELLLNGF